MRILKALAGFVGLMLPKFTTDEVGCRESVPGELYPLYPMQIWNVDADGEPDGVVTIRSFQLLGWSVFGNVLGDPISYAEWREKNRHQEAGQ